MDIAPSIKSMLQLLGVKTASDKTNKGVMLVKTDGNNAGDPAGYVTKEDLAQIVREELYTILNGSSASADSVDKILGLGSGAIKSITDTNLASVLGGVGPTTKVISSGSMDDLTTIGKYRITSVDSLNVSNRPNGDNTQYAVKFFVLEVGDCIIQIAYTSANGPYNRYYWGDSQWTAWKLLG